MHKDAGVGWERKMHVPGEQRQTAPVQPAVNGGRSGEHSRPRDVPLSNVITSLTTAILATVAYYDQFDRPLTTPEIAQRLLGWSADEAAVAAELAHSSQAQSALMQEESYYSMARRAGLARQYQELAVVRAQKWRRVEGFTRAARRMPFVRCIIVGGSVANGSVGPDSDLDLCVLTAERRLWLTRASLVALRYLWTVVRPKLLRRSQQDRIDILFMASASGFASHHRSLYAAILLRDDIVVYDENETADRYVAANTWVLPYCPGFAALRQHDIQPSRPRLMGKRALEWLFSAPLFDGAGRMVYHWWRRRWEHHQRAEDRPSQRMVATPSVADFHSYYWEDRDMSRAFKRFAALGLLPSVEQ